MGNVQRVKRALLVALAAVAVALPANAHAASPCRDRIYNQWYATGKISTSFPISCYRDALKHIPPDAQVYSNLDSSIQAALQAALRRASGSGSARVPSAVGTGFKKPRGPHQTKGARETRVHDPATRRPRVRVLAQPVESSSSSGLPLPIMVLGGVAIALAAAGAIGTGVRYVRRRT